MKPTKPFDVLILGGGIAGLTAAIFAARANMKTAIIEEKACGGLANWTNTIENFPSYVSINGMELMERVLTQVQELGVEVDQAAEIVRLDISGDDKTVETGEYFYSGKAIIIATGRQPVRLQINTDSERIHYCSVCDGSAYAGKKVLVVGGGNSGFDESLYLLFLGVAEILLVENEDNCCACDSTQIKLRSFQNVQIRTSTCVTAIKSEANGCKIFIENKQNKTSENVYVDGVFVFIGQKANSDLFHGLLEMEDSQYIITDSDQCTNIPGVFAAGDVTHKRYRYLTTAMSDGTIAALSAEHYIRSKTQ